MFTEVADDPLIADGFNEAPEKSIAVALRFAIKRSIAMTILITLVKF
jgi:hypothetical protein